jgi:hypothetical protein
MQWKSGITEKQHFTQSGDILPCNKSVKQEAEASQPERIYNWFL